MKCIICSNNCLENKDKGYFKNVNNYYCKKCDVIFYERTKKLEQSINNYYSEEYWKSRKQFKPSLKTKIINNLFKSVEKTRFEYIKKFLKKETNFLEIGIGQGKFIEYLNKNIKLNLSGLEPDNNNCLKIKSKIKNIKIYNSTFEKTKFEQKFHFIFLSHVLEHFMDLDKVMSKIKENLSKDGLIFIEVPNKNNKVMFKESYYNHPHTIEFSEKALKCLFEKNGFEIIKITTHGEQINHSKNKFNQFLQFTKILFKILSNLLNPYYKTKNGMSIRLIAKIK
jgi:2-polyprenyl-3-methyl-5-hydroxy-6-metoxy-1,4-benzoquinol methylase